MDPATNPEPRRLRDLPRNVWAVTLTSFLTDVSSEMLASVLPLFLSNVLGARTAAIGLIEGVAESTASVLKLFSGWLSDRIGQRKWLAVAGYALSTFAKPWLIIASSPLGVLLVRFTDRVGKGLRTAPRDALIADSTPAAQRGLAFGLHRAGDTAGAVIGLLVALVVTRAYNPGIQLTRPVFQTLAVLCIVPAVAAVGILAWLARDTPVPKEHRSPPRLSLAPFDARFRRFLVIVVLFTLGNSSDAFLVLRAQSLGLGVADVLLLMLAFNVVYTIVSGPAGALSDRLGRRTLLITGWLVYAAIYAGFALASTPRHAWMLMTAYGVYYGLTEGAAKAFVADLVPSTLRGTAFGLYHAAVGLTAFPASLLAGLVWQGVGPWQGFGPRAPFALGASFALVAMVLLATTVRPPQAASQPQPTNVDQ